MAPKTGEALVLPASVVSRVDASRLAREVDAIDGFLRQAHVRGADVADEAKLPSLSRTLEDMTHTNRLNLLRPEDRQQLQQFLAGLKKDAPAIHMSFAVVPPPDFTAKLVEWLRGNIHPSLLLTIGLQPSIAAGCVIRTTNKYFDCSVRQHLMANRPKLVELIRSKTR